MIRDYQAIEKSWFPKGEQRIIPTLGKHHGAKLMGVLNYETGAIYVEENDKYDAQVFNDFLHHVLEIYAEGKIVMILDNAKIHHAKLIKPFLEDHADRLELLFLPPYSPKLNIIEGFWGWLKSSVINNQFFGKLSEIQSVVRDFVAYANTIPSQMVNRFCIQL